MFSCVKNLCFVFFEYWLWYWSLHMLDATHTSRDHNVCSLWGYRMYWWRTCLWTFNYSIWLYNRSTYYKLSDVFFVTVLIFKLINRLILPSPHKIRKWGQLTSMWIRLSHRKLRRRQDKHSGSKWRTHCRFIITQYLKARILLWVTMRFLVCGSRTCKRIISTWVCTWVSCDRGPGIGG